MPRITLKEAKPMDEKSAMQPVYGGYGRQRYNCLAVVILNVYTVMFFCVLLKGQFVSIYSAIGIVKDEKKVIVILRKREPKALWALPKKNWFLKNHLTSVIAC